MSNITKSHRICLTVTGVAIISLFTILNFFSPTSVADAATCYDPVNGDYECPDAQARLTPEQMAELYIETHGSSCISSSCEVPAVGVSPGYDAPRYVSCSSREQCDQYYYDYLVYYYYAVGTDNVTDRYILEFLKANPDYEYTRVYTGQDKGLDVYGNPIDESDPEVERDPSVMAEIYDLITERVYLIRDLIEGDLADIQNAIDAINELDSQIDTLFSSSNFDPDALISMYTMQAKLISIAIRSLDPSDPDYDAKIAGFNTLLDETNEFIESIGGDPYVDDGSSTTAPPSGDSVLGDRLDLTYGDFVTLLETVVERIQTYLASEDISDEDRARYESLLASIEPLLTSFRTYDPTWYMFPWDRYGVKSTIVAASVEVGFKGFYGEFSTDAGETIKASVSRDELTVNSTFSGAASLYVNDELRDSKSYSNAPEYLMLMYLGGELTNFLVGNDGFHNTDYSNFDPTVILLDDENCTVTINTSKVIEIVENLRNTDEPLNYSPDLEIVGTQLGADEFEILTYYESVGSVDSSWWVSPILGLPDGTDPISDGTPLDEEFDPPRCHGDTDWELIFG